MSDTHIILLAHGSRDPNWCNTLEQGLEVVTGQLGKNSSLAYLEKASPGLEAEMARQYNLGKRSFVVLPLFFAEGKHLLHDVPEIVQQLEKTYPDITIRVKQALGNYNEFWQFLGALLSREVNSYQISRTV